jgi:hypothetical protein
MVRAVWFGNQALPQEGLRQFEIGVITSACSFCPSRKIKFPPSIMQQDAGVEIAPIHLAHGAVQIRRCHGQNDDGIPTAK